MNNLFIPSFKVEKKTKAFNKYIWFFVSLISLFTVSVALLGFYAFMTSSLDIIDYNKYLYIIAFVPIIIFIILSYQLYLFLSSLLTSYKFENGNLIKGRIIDKDKITSADLTTQTLIMGDEVRNLAAGGNVAGDLAAQNMSNVIQLISCNLKANFVNKYFDTPLYKKKVYTNTKFVQETRYSLIYTSDNKKKIVVPKIYDGMFKVENEKESSFIFRIFIRSLCVFLIAFVLIIGLLVYQNDTKDISLNAISNEIEVISSNLSNYGYSISNNGTSYYVYTKNVDEKESSIKYSFNEKGELDDVHIQLYYNSNSVDVEGELRTIFDSTNYTFDSNEEDEFIQNVLKSINGEVIYDTLTSGDFTIKISTSESYIDIH